MADQPDLVETEDSGSEPGAIPDATDAIPVFLRDRPFYNGYPVPYTALWRDQVPDFTALDTAKWLACVNNGLCSLCGNKIAITFVFVGGERSVTQRLFLEPPMHEECVAYAATVCPYLIGGDPKIIRPDEMYLYTCRGYKPELVKDRYYLRAEAPQSVVLL